MRRSVVLPDPEGPSSETSAPEGIDRLTGSSAVVASAVAFAVPALLGALVMSRLPRTRTEATVAHVLVSKYADHLPLL